MSTKTNFKRIALVAVAALGLGVLSSVPSQAAFSGVAGSQLTLTSSNGTGGLTGSASDSTTAGTVTIKGLALTAVTDSYTVTGVAKSRPTAATMYPALLFALVDTSTSTSATTVVGLQTGRPNATLTTTDTATTVVTAAGAAAGYVNVTLNAFMDSLSATTRVAGTYTYTVVVTPYTGTTATAGTAQTVDISFTVSALASSSTVANAVNSAAYLSTDGAASADSAVSAVATASNTPVGYITVKLRNASGSSGTSASESVTVTTTVGQVGTASNRGRSVVLQYTTDMDVNIYADGTAGAATISVSTPSVTFASKTVTFYSVAPKTIVTSVLNDTLGAGATAGAIGVKATDANGNPWAGTLYVTSDTVGTVSNAASSCSYNATNARHECSLTGVASGTAKISVADGATAAATTVTATAVTVTVNTGAAATMKLTWDKASYAPGEKASLIVSVLDSAGKSVSANTFTNLFSSTAITLSTAAGNGSDAVTSASVTTLSYASASPAYTTTTPVKVYTIYMPSTGGTFKATATGGVSLPSAAQVAVSATATVTDSATAALAAVTALATTVASLKTLITTLTNLVLKIQKKVKA